MVIPKTLKNFNLFLDGINYVGKCESVTLPELKTKDEEWRGGGMDGPVSIDMGMEKLEMKFSMAEHTPQIYQQFGLVNGNVVQVTLRAAGSDDTGFTPFLIEGNGRYSSIAGGELKAGEKNAMEGMIALRYYRLSIGGVEVVEIDLMNCKRIIDGIDVLAGMRAALDI